MHRGLVQVGRDGHREDRLEMRWPLDCGFQLGHGEVADPDHADVAVAPWLGRRPLDEVVHVAAFGGVEEPEAAAGSPGAAHVRDDVDVAAGHPEVRSARLDETGGCAQVLDLTRIR